MAVERGIELRVHGVSGTPPEALLDRPLVCQLDGDRLAGFYAPRLVQERLDDRPNPFATPTSGPHAELEGYTWGGLTSGSPGRAFWLLLTPFTLLNVAIRARPPVARHHPAAILLRKVIRLLALVLTVLFVLTGVGIGERLADPDLVIGAGGFPFAFLAEHRPWLPLLGALLPVVVLLALVAIGYGSSRGFERVQPRYASPRGTVLGATESALRNSRMWDNTGRVADLRLDHLTAGLAVSSMALVSVSVAWLLAVVALVIAAVAVGWPDHRAQKGWRITGLTVVVVALFASALTVPLGSVGPARHSFAPLLVGTTGALLVLLLLLFVANAWAARAASAPVASTPMTAQRQALKGMVPWVISALACLLGLLFTGGIYLYALMALASGSFAPSLRQTSVQQVVANEALVVRWGGVACVVGAGLLLLLVLGFLWYAGRRLGFLGGHFSASVDAAYASDYSQNGEPNTSDPSRTRSIRRDIAVGQLVDVAPTVLALLVAGGVVALAGSGYLVLENRGLLLWGTASELAAVGAVLAIDTLLALVVLGSLAFRVPTTRRVVGVLWDVASFWPRTAHPLGAPCYAERTVPDLVTRLDYLVTEQQRTVVLAPHSQGGVIAMAAVLHLDTVWPSDHPGEDPTDTPVRHPIQHPVLNEPLRPRLRLLTHGCVLRRLYGRYFPAYFGPEQLAYLYGVLNDPRAADAGDPGEAGAPPHWVNLWRYTDYLGGQVTAGPPQLTGHPGTPGAPPGWERHEPDPPAYAIEPGHTTFSRPHRHSDFTTDQSGYYQQAVTDLLA